MTEETIKRYWRVADQFGNHTIINADGFAVSERGDLAFHSDIGASWQKHMTNKRFWKSVTECDQDGKPLWSRDVPKKEISIEANITHADAEALSSYIKSVTESAIRKATED